MSEIIENIVEEQAPESRLLSLEKREEIVTKWLEALRSGKYEQAKFALRRTEASDDEPDYGAGMCCLGVLCDVSGLGKWMTGDGEDAYRIEGDKGETCLYDRSDVFYSATMLPGRMAEMLGMDRGGQYHTGEHIDALYNLNDEKNKSFEEIADTIEKHKADIFSKWPEHQTNLVIT